MADTDINDLHPDLKPLAEEFLRQYTALGRKVKIIQTWRSSEYQAELHAKNPTGAAPPGKSKHEFMIDGKPASKAFDFALYDEDGDYIEDGTDNWYAEAGDIATNLGLLWGGNFVHAKKDWDHCELKG